MKCLIIKTSSLGDIIQSFPALQYLRKHVPYAEIDWVVEAPFVDLVKAHPEITNVIPVQTHTWRRSLFSFSTWKEMRVCRNQLRLKEYDVVFDLQGNIKSSLILSQVRAKNKIGFGLKAVSEWPNIFFTHRRYNPPQGHTIRDDYLFLIQSFLKTTEPFLEKEILLQISSKEKSGLEQFLDPHKHLFRVLVCPGAAWENKRVSHETWISLLKNIEQKQGSYFYFLWGTEKEKLNALELASHFPKQGCLLERFSLPVLQNLMNEMDLVIAMDSLPLHLCGTTRTPTLSFFGPSSAEKYRPQGNSHISYQGECPYSVLFEKRCPNLRRCPTGQCIKNISKETILSLSETVLSFGGNKGTSQSCHNNVDDTLPLGKND